MSMSVSLSIILKLFLLYFLFLDLVYSQTNKQFEYDGFCQQLESTNPCFSQIALGSLVFISKNINDTRLLASSSVIGLASLGIHDDNCNMALSKLYCSLMYPPCVQINVKNSTISLPSLPCKSVCDEAFQSCSSEERKDFLIYPNCVVPMFGMPLFPETQSSFNLSMLEGSDNQIVQCNNNYTSKILGCPKPLEYIEGRVGKGNFIISGKCAFPCPFSFWKSKAWITDLIQIVISSLSFASGLLLIIFYGVLPTKLTNRMEIVLSFGIANVIISVTYFMITPGFSYCGSTKRFMEQTDPLCIINGMLFQFGALSIIFWWVIHCYDFFLTIRMEKNHYFRYQRLAAWLLAFVFTVIPLMGSSYSSSPSTSGCWIYKNKFCLYFSFFAPSWICLIFVITTTIYSSYKIFSLYAVLKDKKVLLYNAKQIFLMIIVVFNFLFVSIYHYYVSKREAIMAATLLEWIYCLVSNGESNCPLLMPDFDMRIIVTVVSSCNGLVGLFAFGLESHNVKVFKESKLVLLFMNRIGINWSLTSTVQTTTSPNLRKSQSNLKLKPISKNASRSSTKSLTTDVEKGTIVAENNNTDNSETNNTNSETNTNSDSITSPSATNEVSVSTDANINSNNSGHQSE